MRSVTVFNGLEHLISDDLKNSFLSGDTMEMCLSCESGDILMTTSVMLKINKPFVLFFCNSCGAEYVNTDNGIIAFAEWAESVVPK